MTTPATITRQEIWDRVNEISALIGDAHNEEICAFQDCRLCLAHQKAIGLDLALDCGTEPEVFVKVTRMTPKMQLERALLLIDSLVEFEGDGEKLWCDSDQYYEAVDLINKVGETL